MVITKYASIACNIKLWNLWTSSSIQINAVLPCTPDRWHCIHKMEELEENIVLKRQMFLENRTFSTTCVRICYITVDFSEEIKVILWKFHFGGCIKYIYHVCETIQYQRKIQGLNSTIIYVIVTSLYYVCEDNLILYIQGHLKHLSYAYNTIFHCKILCTAV